MRTNKLVDLYKCVYNNPRDTSLCLHSIILAKMGKIARGLEIFGSVSFYLVECQSAVESKRESFPSKKSPFELAVSGDGK